MGGNCGVNAPHHSTQYCSIFACSTLLNTRTRPMLKVRSDWPTFSCIHFSYFSRYLYPKLGHDRKTNEFIPYKENAILTMPFHHMYGFDYLNRALVEGTTGVILRKFHNTVFLNSIQKFRVSFLITAVLKVSWPCSPSQTTAFIPYRQTVLDFGY